MFSIIHYSISIIIIITIIVIIIIGFNGKPKRGGAPELLPQTTSDSATEFPRTTGPLAQTTSNSAATKSPRTRASLPQNTSDSAATKSPRTTAPLPQITSDSAATKSPRTTAPLPQITSDSAATKSPRTTAAVQMITTNSTLCIPTTTTTQTSQYGMFQMKGSMDSRLPTHVLVTRGTGSVINCARLCEFCEECQSFNYREEASNGLCELNTMKITSILQLIPATGYTYWEK